MNWIRKTVIFISLLILAFFASQESNAAIQEIEGHKTDTNFSKDYTDSLAFIQPQASYQFAANIKTHNPGIIKWFDSLLVVIPQHQVVKSASNFANQFSTQSKRVLLMLYPFHFFW
ncbi:hypothetical protein SAMN05444397_101461 [Flavobacterium aquidurense]|uniref:Uncharacterized protein n=1 Tax=Flavobacterium frigidimaris TaxID=262320 RepID=A0ABX4BKU0_FLAFR|nr:hypothetical protein [Flavobacterium frigidimaris]OXA76051.1 hypothetical protein B0A65_19540 [Flavobacterium frigidimaris]SDY36821.1 hypothetical protein SAMN05444397_101461 [Flavobacterium aquidurense]